MEVIDSLNHKICSKCKINKSLDNFYKDSQKLDKLGSCCKSCKNSKNAEWISKNKEKYLAYNKDYMKERYKTHKEQYKGYHKKYYNKNKDKCINSSRNGSLKRNYNIDIEEYNKLLKEQNHRCKICKSDNTGRINTSFAVDHDHKTGKIRGLLCTPCNVGLGNFKDNKIILESALEYLNLN